jgi:hypothetical protein
MCSKAIRRNSVPVRSLLRLDAPATTLGSPLVSPGFEGFLGPADPSQRTGRQRHLLEVDLPAGEPGIVPLVQFCQIRQAVYRQLLGIALASRGEVFNISANFFP